MFVEWSSKACVCNSFVVSVLQREHLAALGTPKLNILCGYHNYFCMELRVIYHAIICQGSMDGMPPLQEFDLVDWARLEVGFGLNVSRPEVGLGLA